MTKKTPRKQEQWRSNWKRWRQFQKGKVCSNT